MKRAALILAMLLVALAGCADDSYTMHRLDLSALEPWQQDVTIQKAGKWNAIYGERRFRFDPPFTGSVTFGDALGHDAMASGGSIVVSPGWWVSCSDKMITAGLTFDDMIAHELGHLLGLVHSNDQNDIMSNPGPFCEF